MTPVRPRCLVVGASGFLGSEVLALLSKRFDAVGTGHNNRQAGLVPVDIRDRETFQRLLTEFSPQVVVQCAAHRDPDFCEDHPADARRLNVAPVKVLVESLPADTRIVFISSDYVFDGDTPPYAEDAPRRPANVYGQTKVEAEDALRGRPCTTVLRVPVMIGAQQPGGKPGFIERMIESVRAKKRVVVDDVIVRFPTWTRDVAHAVDFLLEKGVEGVVHYSGPRGGTQYAWTMEMAGLLGESAGHVEPSREIVPRKARRPLNAQLATGKIRALGLDRFTDFREVLRSVI